ncbi:MAG: hypothetical protein ACI8W8_004207 [Rhodothermales bacterium]|jgi:hypothetical protein
MSVAIWINRLQDGEITSDQEDRLFVLKHASKLDKVCQKLGVKPLSSFHDTTDAEMNVMGLEDQSDEVDFHQLISERGKWFNPQAGVDVLGELLADLEREPIRFGLLSNDYDDVMADLAACKSAIEFAQAAGARFHMSIVM